VTGFYDRLRAQVGPRTPICAVGTSAGGQLALMLATRRDLACMISEDGPPI
jgi:dienelactone hydrolase